MSGSASDWIAGKLKEDGLIVAEQAREGFLVVQTRTGYEFLLGVLGVKGVIELSDVRLLFAQSNHPNFVVNVPSSTVWSGAAIDHIHAASAAFGTLSDVIKAADTHDAGSYRKKSLVYFINAIKQHTNVANMSYVYERVFLVHRRRGLPLKVAIIDTYHMSAEDVRNTKAKFKEFDIVVKSSNYGSITSQAASAAAMIGAEALSFGDFLRRLAN